MSLFAIQAFKLAFCQYGFRKHFSTIRYIHLLNTQLEESHDFNMTFIEFKKAFDTVELAAILQALESFEVDDNPITSIQLSYAIGSTDLKTAGYQAELNIQVAIKEIRLSSSVHFREGIEREEFCHRGFRFNGKTLPFLAYADEIMLLSTDLHELKNISVDLTKASKQIGLMTYFENIK
ncbi:hypothetical protein Y032_0007g3470 [Ancylostoma ceylanicum]|uniref:Reverse transcriptase domain-containing protein n=1 Tax=Ancylostoma ceylanicum TaxID=53326 RepID=A0A016VP92_9BILA|nr:hypothetical protein Y032_0007g3470 [Ancylostoma ceylanicum]